MHLLIWLKDITKIQHQLIRADIPNDNPDLSYLVNKYQQSDKPSHSLKLQTEETFFQNTNGKQILHLKHPAEEFALNLRAYISTVLPTLQCSMDFQTTDGRAMLLRYVTSYVTKNQDGIDPDSLYSEHISGGQAATRYVMDMKPAEPEMWLALSSTKIARSPSRTKRYNIPSVETCENDKTANKYRNRTESMSEQSFLNWLRLTDHTKTVPKAYRKGNNTLVGLKTVSFFNKHYFFQYLLMNLPHKSINELRHPNHDKIPENLQWYAAAIHHFPDVWKNDEKVAHFLHNEGNRDTYITTCLAYLHTLADMFFLWQSQIISSLSLNIPHANQTANFTLNSEQQVIQNHVVSAFRKRAAYYSTPCPPNTLQTHLDSDNEEIEFDQPIDSQDDQCVTAPAQCLEIIWTKPLLLTGQAGCGKSHVIKSIVKHLIELNASVLVAAPTGFLTAVFRATLDEQVDCQTVHASFNFPVDETLSPTINWQLANYDVIIIDELSMIPNVIFRHITKTFNVLLFRPVVVLGGDSGQQQPFCNHNGKIMQIDSALDDNCLMDNSYHYLLRTQHRVEDASYLSFLQTIRKWVPSQQLLDEIQESRVISEQSSVTDLDILNAYYTSPENTILTFTKNAANRINEVVISSLFQTHQPLTYAQLDCESPPMPLYKGMRVMITQNRDKPNGVVNGQLAVIHMVENRSVLLKFPNEKIVAIYPVTVMKGNSSVTLYPLLAAYATTMCKAQGQTLKKVVLWFDIDNIPPGTAYIALSRVKNRNDIHFLNKLKPTTLNQSEEETT